jgi:LacI family transcriptional regulator
MPTIHDVAKRAGVAPMTVSRVINRSGYFSEEVGSRVQAAVAELGYIPNSLARGLRSKRTQTLALILTDITNPFFTQAARGVEDAASEAGFTVIYCNTDESEKKEAAYLGLLRQKQVDGLLLVPARSSSKSVDEMDASGIPVVVMDRRLAGGRADVVRCDSQGGACELTRLLVAHGHRRIAMFSGPPGISTAADRISGYRRALAEAGLSGAEWVLDGAFNQKSGYELACRALETPNRPTALLAANNFIAIGALKALHDRGLGVPGDLSVVAFDDLPEAMLVSPFLTVISQPAYEMGRQAAGLLLQRLSGEGPREPQEIVLPVKLIERQSVGRPAPTPQKG